MNRRQRKRKDRLGRRRGGWKAPGLEVYGLKKHFYDNLCALVRARGHPSPAWAELSKEQHQHVDLMIAAFKLALSDLDLQVAPVRRIDGKAQKNSKDV